MFLLTKLFTFGFLFALFPVAVNPESMIPQPALWIETFDHQEIPKTVGTWEHNILDSNQGISIELIDQDAGNKPGGKSLAIHFDVDSSNPAMAGCWIKLKHQDLTGFDTLHFSMKSGAEERFTGNVAVQLTDSGNRKAPYLISGVGSEWKEYQISLKKFTRIADWSGIKDFEIVIDDINARPKEGTLLIDEIYVTKDVSA